MNTEEFYKTMHSTFPEYRENNQGLLCLEKWAGLLKRPALIVEIGCGNGLLCEVLTLAGFNMVGLDTTRGPYPHENYKFIKHDLTAGPLPFANNEFDYCLSFDVLEHLPEDSVAEVIQHIGRISTNAILSIACYGSLPLHLTVKKADWWIEMCTKHYPDMNWKIIAKINRDKNKRVLLIYGQKPCPVNTATSSS